MDEIQRVNVYGNKLLNLTFRGRQYNFYSGFSSVEWVDFLSDN